MAIQVPPTALAATLRGPYSEPYEFLQQQVSPPGEKEALVSLSFSGVCHGDVYSRDGGGPAPPVPHRPLIGGHEGVGTIVALGPNAANSCSFRIGDLVGIAWRTSVCGKCEPCLSGRENHCGEQVITGLHASGTYQQYITFSVDQLIPIPDGIDLPQACCVLCAGVTAFSSLRLMDPQPGTWCVIAGAAGGLGHLAIQYAKCFGLRVLAIDGGGADKEAFFRDMGADTSWTSSKRGWGWWKSDVGEYARFGGQIMVIGIGNCSFPLRPILKKALLVRSNQTGTKDDIREALKLTVSGQVKCKIEVMGLEALNEALDRLKAGKVLGKLVVNLR